MQMETETKRKFLHFDDILDFADYANKVPEDNWSKIRDDHEWCGGSFEDAMKQAKTGNPELCQKIFDDVKIIEALIKDDKKADIRDVTGEYFDIGTVLSNEPECWFRKEINGQKPVIPIYASFGMLSSVDVDLITTRGAAIVALIDELEQNGFIVDLHLEKSTEYRGHIYHYSIDVRTDPIDVDTIAFIIANPLCQRRLSFAVLENITNQDCCSGYGYSVNYDPKRILQNSDLSGFYFCCSSSQYFRNSNYESLEAAKKHIMNMLEMFKNNAAQVIFG